MSSIWRTLFIATVGVVVFGCAQKPTKIFTSEDVDVLFLEKNLSQPLEITGNTVIIDARTPFEFAMAHYPSAINMQWTDFSDPTEGVSPGRLKKDLAGDARRLALAGVGPDSQVVVVGKGLEGAGVEGRIAWTLLYMGVHNVQTADSDKLGLRYSNLTPPPRENSPMWQSSPRESISVDKDEFLGASSDPQVKVIDVRTTFEFGNPVLGLGRKYPNIKAINLEWTRFFTFKGRPNTGARKLLENLQIHPHDRILLISNQGVRSGAVTYALLSLGFKHAANYAGGLVDLLNLKK